MIANIVLLQRGNDVAPATPFEHPCLLADNLERRADAAFCQHLGQPQTGIIICWQKVIFRVEPEDDIDPRLLRSDRTDWNYKCKPAQKADYEVEGCFHKQIDSPLRRNRQACSRCHVGIFDRIRACADPGNSSMLT